MIPIRSNLMDYINGGIVVILGLFALILPSLLIAGISDTEISPISIPVLAVGAVLGFPVIGTGIALTQKRHQLAIYLGVLTGIVYAAVPAVGLETLFFPYYIPSAIVFITIFIALTARHQ